VCLRCTRIVYVYAHTGTGILVSAAALSEPERYASRFAGKFLVEGKSEPLLVFEVFASPTHPRMRNAPVLARAIALYQQAQIEEALAMFQSIVNLPDEMTAAEEESSVAASEASGVGGGGYASSRCSSLSRGSSVDDEANERIDGVVQLYIESCTQILRAGGAKRLPSNWQSVLSVTKGGRVLFDTSALVCYVGVVCWRSEHVRDCVVSVM
jgi:hypothetical protein